MKKLFLTCCFCLNFLAAALAQEATGVAPLDQLVAAINAKSVEPLQPYLTPETRLGSLPPAYTARVLAQLIPQFGPLEGFRVVRQTTEGANTRYVCAITRKGTEKEYDFLLTPTGTFAELNLAQASLKKIDTAFKPEDLTTPPSLDVPVRISHDLLLVEAEADGRRGWFFLDSGAPALMLNKKTFPPAATETTLAVNGAKGVNGAVGGMSYHLTKTFDWSGIRFENKEVATLDLTGLEQQTGVELLGIIGFNLLNQYALTLDYRAQKVLLRKPTTPDALPAPLMRVPFTLRGHLPVVAMTANGQTFQMGIDCGAQNNLLDQQFEAAFANKLRKPEKSTLHGGDGALRTVTSGQLADVRLAGPLPFRNQQTVFSDISQFNQNPDKTLLQGLLGYPLLSQYRTTIDYVNKQLEFRKW
ncbi:aspartyl protease family protein [Hymenobacter artigasi]|uniref:Aspartyl protease n=1 Tax=Hymenobacter artigasi TaxID=2719616 RepID=A0ABX1HFG3_9BACT|nr:aspartyl protease family protein [Hymenobacter artigasi]NKI88984.1 hypothetical protein [Hymenobacter artigasi]